MKSCNCLKTAFLLIFFLSVIFSQSIPEVKYLTSIGGDDKIDDLNYILDSPIDITVDSRGFSYILEENGSCVKVFDDNLKFVKSFARNGNGPGEFARVSCIGSDSKNNIFVADPGNGRIHMFNSEGQLLGATKAGFVDLNFNINSSDKLIFRNPNLDGGRKLGKNNVPLFCQIDNNGKLSNLYGQGIYYTKFPFKMGGNRLNFCLDKEDNIIIAFLFQNKLQKYTPEGKLVFEKILNPNRKKLIDKELSMYSTLNQGVAVDDKNRIWILNKQRDESKKEKIQSYVVTNGSTRTVSHKGDLSLTETNIYSLDCYDESGNLITKIPLSHFCDSIKIFNNKIYIVECLREMKIYVYGIAN